MSNLLSFSPGGGGVTVGTTVFTGGTVGSVLFIGAASVVQQNNANFFWDNTNLALGIGTTTPGTVGGDAGTFNTLQIHRASGYGLLTLSSNLTTDTSGGGAVSFGSTTAGSADKRFSTLTGISDGSSSVTTNGAMLFYTNNAGTMAERMRINKSGFLGVNLNNPLSMIHVVESTAGGSLPRGILMQQAGNDVNPPVLLNRKSRGTASAPTTVSNGDFLLNISTQGYDGASWVHTTQTSYVVDGAVAAGSIPTGIAFYTGTGSGGSERLRITSGGDVGIGRTAPGALLDVNGWILWGGGSHTTSNFVVNNTTTLAAITGLSATLTAGKAYTFTLVLSVTTPTGGGYNFDLNGGTATVTSLEAGVVSVKDSATTTALQGTGRLTALNSTFSDTTANGATFQVTITGTLLCNAGGTFKPRFAQSTASPFDTTLNKNSSMIIDQVA